MIDEVDLWIEHRLDHRVHRGFAGCISSHDDAQFFVDVHGLFQDTRRVKTTFHGIRFRTQDLDAFPVVPAFAQFLNHRKAHGPHFVNGGDEFVGCAGNAPTFVGLFLKALVLDQAQMLWPWHHLDPGIGQGI